jgi:hypothetical protein
VERSEELAVIAAWLAEHQGPRRVPAGFAGEVQAALPLAEERERVAEFRPVMRTRSQVYRELMAKIYGYRWR